MNITITNVKNANELDSFIPVEGEWVINEASSDDISREDVEESVRNYMDADYKIDVKLFRLNGREFDDLPMSGTFLAVRK